ncbi:MAG: methyltransferase domain-containing protein [Dehalococcoidia bacterium]|nr:methyltransferase domain-containing protein [Dehalococcoidia bacterium]
MWKLKLIVQFVLAHLPWGERINYLLQVVNKSHSPETIEQRIPKLLKGLKFIDGYVKLEGSSVLEIGTGWEAINAILLYLMGARTVYTYDHVPHVRYGLVQNLVKQIDSQIEQIYLITSIPKSVLIAKLRKLENAANLEMIFKSANIVYRAPGDATKTGLSDNCIDLIYSYAVLEHVPETMIHDLTVEAKRVLRTNGVAYHVIGLHDHYADFDKKLSKVNFLRYPEWIWSLFVKNKISYHNRLREKQLVEIMESHGGKVQVISSKVDPNDLEILKTMKIDERFSGMTHEELAVYYSEVVLSF